MINEIIHLDPENPEVTLEVHAVLTDTPRTAMLVIPGGGYGMVCSDREGGPIAETYLAHGINSFVLNYRVGPVHHHPEQLIDAARAIHYIRENADKYGVDPDRIFTVGFSAGGHLVGLIATKHREAEGLLDLPENSTRPTGSVYCYPVVSTMCPTHGGSFDNLSGKRLADFTEHEKQYYSIEVNVTSETPPAFIWHTATDDAVPVYGSLRLAESYIRQGVTVSLHIYPYGPHGVALANELTMSNNPAFVQPLAQGWVDSSVEWIKTV